MAITTVTVKLRTFGERLRELRESARVQSREFDRLCGLPEGHTAVIEFRGRHGVSEVETATALRIAGVLGVRLEWLLTGRGISPAAQRVRTAIASARARYARAHGTAAGRPVGRPRKAG